jgi:uncharacterized phage protein gp47/JayE
MSDTNIPIDITALSDPYGMLPSGFVRMRYPEILQAIITDLQARTGLTFETRPDSITGQFIATFAEREAAMWELAEAVYHAMYPISASSINLDHSVSFSGVKRLFAIKSVVWCGCYGQEGTVISAGSIIQSNISLDHFLLDTNVTILKTNAVDVTLRVTTAVEGELYWVNVNGQTCSYTALAGDTPIEIVNNLMIKVESTPYEVEVDGDHIRIYNFEATPFTIDHSVNMTVFKLGSPGWFTAENTGYVDVTPNTLNIIISTAVGWDSVNNYIIGHMGRPLETDDELRLRYEKGVFRLGAGTLDSIKANLLQNVPGIISLNVYENKTDVMDNDGRLPHSIEVVVYGGDTKQIAQEIYLRKAAGIDTNGAIEVVVLDSSGYKHYINFNRPTEIWTWVNVAVTLYTEESFPDNAYQIVQKAVIETGNAFGVGKDIILQRFYGPIYKALSGVGRLDITACISTDPNYVPLPTDYLPNNIPIAANQLSRFTPLRVNTVVVTAP